MTIQNLFVIDPKVTGVIRDRRVIEQTFADMKKLGIAKPPFSDFSIQIMHDETTISSEEGWTISIGTELTKEMPRGCKISQIFNFADVKDDSTPGISARVTISIDVYNTEDNKTFHHHIPPEELYASIADVETQGLRTTAEDLYETLIVLLATKNVRHEVKRKAVIAVMPDGRKARAEYSTTLKIGKITENYDGTPVETGRNIRPHLRRGHVRTQHWGPSSSYTKKIFIEPTFVNGVSNERHHYNVSMEKQMS